MALDVPIPDSHVLHSWKEISLYTGRGVRTLQRYESHLGFPVHRPSGKPRSSVLAFREEINRWLAETPVIARDGELRAALPAKNGTRQFVDGARNRAQSNFTQDRKASLMREDLNAMVKNLEAMRKGVATMRLLAIQSSRRLEQGRILRSILRERSRGAVKLAEEILKSHGQIAPPPDRHTSKLNFK